MQNQLLEDDSNVFAPIIIPTLNRVDHLRRCIDSLARNKWADHTDIYISVDYPPAAKYEEGYNKVCQLLESYDFSSFKSYHVIYQKENLGPSANFAFLQSLIRDKGFTKYISTEDDNEFSPNFLEYIDRCFLAYNDDPNVIAICGCKDCEWVAEDDTNIVKVKLFAAYGVGQWFSKKENIVRDCASMFLNKKEWTAKRFFRLYKKNKTLFTIYVLGILSSEKSLFMKAKNEISYVDSVISIFMHLSDKTCIAPVTSKSRTWGNDGSGVNMPAREYIEPTEIDMNQNFSIKHPERVKFNQKNYKIGDDYMSVARSKTNLFHAWLNVLILLFTFKNRDLLIKIDKFIKKLK